MSHETTADCLNCGAFLEGKYCSRCGQKATGVRLTLHDFLHETVHEFLHLDGKIVRTIKLLLFRPGTLTREFLDGRRVRYISPVRVYLTWSLIFFGLLALVPDATKTMIKVNTGPGDPARTGIERQLDDVARKAEGRTEQIGEEVMHNLPRVMFFLMPVFGLLTWAFYRKQERYYIPHLYYSIHFHSFVFFLMSLYVLTTLGGEALRPLGALIVLASVPYHFLALRRVFGGSRTATFVKGAAIGLIYWLTTMLTVLALVFAVAMLLD